MSSVCLTCAGEKQIYLYRPGVNGGRYELIACPECAS